MRLEAKTALEDSLTTIQCTHMHPDTKLSQFHKKKKKNTAILFIGIL